MPRSSTTRHGTGSKGPGYGGPAKGPGKPPGAIPGLTGQMISDGKKAARSARELASQHAVAMAELLVSIATNPQVPAATRVDAANKLIERAEGRPVAPVEMQATVTQREPVDRPPRETREQWLERRKREIGTAALLGTPAGSAD